MNAQSAPGDGGKISARMGIADWSLLVLLSLLWGGSFFFVGVAVREWPPLIVVLCRVAGGALLLWIAVYAMGQRMPKDPVIWGAFFGMGVLNNVVPFILNVWGQTHIASGVASILNATSPLFTALAAHFLTADEKLTPLRGAGVLLGLAGVTAMVGGPALLAGAGEGLWPLLGQLAVVAAAISYAFAGIFGRRFRRLGVTPMATAAGQVTAATIVMLPAVLLVEPPWHLPAPSMGLIGALCGLAALSTALAYIIYFRVLSSAGATNIMLVTFLIPPSAILLGVFLLGEQLALRHFAGMALIGMGLVAIDGRLADFGGARR